METQETFDLELAISDLSKVIEHLKEYIEPCESEEDRYIQCTIATDDSLSAWTYQSGDNSYTGSCYHFPHWEVFEVVKDSNAQELAKEAFDNLLGRVAEYNAYKEEV